MKDKTKKFSGLIIAVIFFLFALYLTEISPFGSDAVAAHNGGYGVFDMNRYDTHTVKDVLSNTNSTGMSLYPEYYICDFIFIAAFAVLQFFISGAVFKKTKSALFRTSVIFIFLRALSDAAENIMLINIIRSYPTINDSSVQISAVITKCKFAFMFIWFAVLLAGAVIRIIRKKNKNS